MAWGANGLGSLGDGINTGPETCIPGADFTTSCSLVPVAVSGLSEAKSIAAGGGHSLALLNDGTVVAWGGNGSGQLGAGEIIGPQHEQVAGPETCEGFVGSTYYFPCSMTPIAVSGLSEVTQIAAGEAFSLALLKNGTVKAWGSNEAGCWATSQTRMSTVPVAVGGLSEVTAIAAGEGFALALRKNGTVMGWGDNGNGQLGAATARKTAKNASRPRSSAG